MIAAAALGALNAAAAVAAPPKEERESVIGPEYRDAPELTVPADAPRGRLVAFKMDSRESRIYPGIAKRRTDTVPYTRDVVVYIPAQLPADVPAPFLVVHDGLWYRDVTVPILDTLIHQKRIPPIVALFVHNGGDDAQGSQRGLEYDTMSGRLAEYVETEVLPRVVQETGVTLTKDPDGRATMGGSSGAAAALSMAWYRPDLYRRVLSYSGTFVNQQWPYDPATPRGAWEYHATLIPNTKRKPLRIWFENSENDLGADRDEASLHNWVMANERMRAALKAKGYDYRYVFAKAAGHTDGRVTRQTLPGALEWLWRGYRPGKR